MDVPLDQLANHPLNPDPTEDEVLEMMQWLMDEKQSTPLIVRPDADGYEVLCGKRRFAAARRLGWESLSCEVRPDLPGEAGDVFAMRDNLRRRTEDQLRQAAWMQGLADKGYDDNWIAKKCGCSRPKVANTRGLLKLPAAWQDRLREKSINVATARAMVPFAPYTSIMSALETGWKREGIARQLEQDPGACLRRIAVRVSRQCGKRARSEHWIDGFGYTDIAFDSDDHRERLQIVSLPLGANGKQQERALNCTLWDKLQKAGLAAKKTKSAEREAGKSDGKPAKKSAAEAKQDAARKKEILASKYSAWLDAFLRRLIVPLISDADWQVQRVIFCLANQGPNLKASEGVYSHHVRAAALAECKLAVQQRKRQGAYDLSDSLEDCWREVKQVELSGKALAAGSERHRLMELQAAYVRCLLSLQPKDREWQILPQELVRDLAEDYGIDLAQEWRGLQVGTPRHADFEAFLQLHDFAQLQWLADEWDVPSGGYGTRKALIAGLMGQAKSFGLPKSLQQVTKAR